MNEEPGSAVAPRSLHWLPACLILALALAVVGCGGDDEPQPRALPLDAGLSYLRSDSAVAFVFSTDLENGDLGRLHGARLRADGRRGLEAALRSGLAQRGFPFKTVVRPQFGNPFVLGITRGGDQVGAIRVKDAVRLRQDITEGLDQGRAERLEDHESALVWKEKRPDAEARYAALHDRELVVAQTEKDLKEAIDASRGSENLAHNRPLKATLASLGRRALVRAVGDAQRLLDSGDPLQAADARKVRWVRALGLFTLDVVVTGRGLAVDFKLGTNRVKLTERDLPLFPGAASPRLHDPNAPASVAVLEPRELARFLERTLQATDPARFGRYEIGVEQLRSILRVNLHRDLLDKITSLSLAATSATAFTFEGKLAPGSEEEFRRDLDRAQLFVQGVLGDVAPGTSVDARGIGAQRVWVVKNGGITLARYAVRGGTLVGSVGTARLPAPVRGRRVRGVTGSLVLKGDLGRIGRLLDFLQIPGRAFGVVSPLGELTLGIQTDTEQLHGAGRVRLRRAG